MHDCVKKFPYNLLKKILIFYYFYLFIFSFQSTSPFKYIFSSSAGKKGAHERKDSAGSDKTTDDEKKTTEADNVNIYYS